MVDSNPAAVEAWRPGCLEAWEVWVLYFFHPVEEVDCPYNSGQKVRGPKSAAVGPTIKNAGCQTAGCQSSAAGYPHLFPRGVEIHSLLLSKALGLEH